MFSSAHLRTAVLATATLTIAATAPLAASADVPRAPLPAGSYAYHTSFTPLYFGGGDYEGVLRFTVANDGSIVGTYRNQDVGIFRTIVGGVTGQNVWLDLGAVAEGHLINATVKNGDIVGGVYANGQPYRFVAEPDAR